MKKTYLKPSLEVTAFEAEDILTASVATDMALNGGIAVENIASVDVSDTSGWSDYSN